MSEPDPTIVIQMGEPCRKCGNPGRTPSGLCLGCITKGLQAMTNDQQLSLTTEYVDLTDDEKMARGADLANLIRESVVLAADHKDRKAAMREEREALEQKIAHVADVVRMGKEERPKALSR